MKKIRVAKIFVPPISVRADLMVRPLAEHIRIYGQLTPILVRKAKGREKRKRTYKYVLLCGFRRVAAMKLLKKRIIVAQMFDGIVHLENIIAFNRN